MRILKVYECMVYHYRLNSISNGEEIRTMKNLARISLLASTVFLLSLICTGCIVGRYYEGPNIVAEKVKDIKPGVTTKQEIIEWFGPPQNYLSPTVFNKILQDLDITGEPLGTFPFANILSYQYDQANIRALVLVLFNYAEAKVKSDHLVIFVDENERVKYYGFYRGTEEL